MRTAIAFTALALAACAGAPVASNTGAAIGALPELAASRTARIEPELALGQWWTLFGDPQLDELMTQALQHNHDLATAAARVREARARLDEAHASTLPSVDLQGQAGRGRQSADGLPPGAQLTRSHHQASLVTQYDVDLWGRLASINDAARLRLASEEWARAAVEWSLTAQLAEAHFSLRAVQRQIDISEGVRDGRARTLALRQRELAAGISSEFESRRAQAELAGTESTLASLRRQRVDLEGTIALLCGQPIAELASAGQARLPLDPSTPFDARLPSGGAAQLLVRRPDLREAEGQLAAARVDIDAARAAALPALRLSGSLGSDAQSLSRLFTGPGAVWSLAASVSSSLFDGGANQARVEQARARHEAALAQYRKAVLAALLELREAYAALDLSAQALEAQADRVAALERSRRLAQTGVDAGALARIDLLDAERNAYQAQLDEVAAYRDRLIAQVAVMKALGGGYAIAPTPTKNS